MGDGFTLKLGWALVGMGTQGEEAHETQFTLKEAGHLGGWEKGKQWRIGRDLRMGWAFMGLVPAKREAYGTRYHFKRGWALIRLGNEWKREAYGTLHQFNNGLGNGLAALIRSDWRESMDFPLPSRTEGNVPPVPTTNATLLTLMPTLKKCGMLRASYDMGFIRSLGFNPECNGVTALAACQGRVSRGCQRVLERDSGGNADGMFMGVNGSCVLSSGVAEGQGSNPAPVQGGDVSIFSVCGRDSKNVTGNWTITAEDIRSGPPGDRSWYPQTLRLNVSCSFQEAPNGSRGGSRAAVFAVLADSPGADETQCLARNAAAVSEAFATFVTSERWKEGWMCRVGPAPSAPVFPYDCWKGVRAESADNFTIIFGRRQATVGFRFLGFYGGRDLLYAVYTGLLGATFAAVALAIALLVVVFALLGGRALCFCCRSSSHRGSDVEAATYQKQ